MVLGTPLLTLGKIFKEGEIHQYLDFTLEA